MLEIFQYWQVNLSIAVVLFVVLYQYYRLLARDSNNSASIPVIVGFISSIIFISMMPFFGMKFPTVWYFWILLLLSNFLYTGNDLLKFIGFKRLDVSVVAIFSQLSKVFRETLTLMEAVGISLIVFGSSLVSFEKNKFTINKYIWAVIGASFFFALAMIIDVGISKQFNLAFYFFMMYFVPAILIIVGKQMTFLDLKKEFFKTKNSPKFFVLASLASSIGMLTYLLALRQGQVSIVAPLSSITVLLNVLAGYIFLKERTDLAKRLVAAVFVIVGVFLLV
jgi:drug/metabolite transporter (DMT)-like permease